MPNNDVSITISGSTSADFLTQFGHVAKQFGFVPIGEADNATADAADAAPKTRRGRPPKADAAPAEAAVSQPTTSAEADLFDDAPAEEPKPLTIDDAKNAGKELLALGRTDKVRAILAKFAVAKVTDLKPPQFDGFVKECKAAAA